MLVFSLLFFLWIGRPQRSTHCISSAASDVYKRQVLRHNQLADRQSQPAAGAVPATGIGGVLLEKFVEVLGRNARARIANIDPEGVKTSCCRFAPVRCGICAGRNEAALPKKKKKKKKKKTGGANATQKQPHSRGNR
eukprot:TRINITY_DN20344_c0_g1_i1.p3 TRINITY_DN20344_c0_g1~~TRINITY_DN20344_c0_g1_i1.p3  ORF type:complete len:137 (+),score=21.80 TRINITY_DN20344_c0_g1_i1:2-412(+)